MVFGNCLSRYLARFYMVNFLGMIAMLLGIVFLFDMVELLRRAGKEDDVPFNVVINMALLRLPEMATTIAPFAILFSALFTFWQLSKRLELVVLRSSGVSVWQFLAPMVGSAFLTGLVMVMLANPLAAMFYNHYTSLEQTYLEEGKGNVIAVFDQGLWLRQETSGGYAIIHAGRIDPDWRLADMIVFFFGKDNSFEERIDAPSAHLKSGNWELSDAVLNIPGQKSRRSGTSVIPTNLTPQEIEDSFSSPKAMGFWSLPDFIGTLDTTGFDSTRLRIHFQSLLAQPLLYAAMIILAACVAMRPQRQGQTFLFILIGVITGFVMFFMSNYMQALGASHKLPVFMAAWSPAILGLLVGTTFILRQEDG